MRVLVTGANGFVGHPLVEALSAVGHEVFGVIRPDQGPKSTLMNVIEMNLNEIDLSRLPSHVDAVVTLAQSPYFRDFPSRSDDIFSVNVTANFKIFDWAASNGVKIFIHVSSGGVYGGKLGEVLSEDQPLSVDSPLGFYLGSKLCSEIIFQNYAGFFDTSVVLRPFFIYGPNQNKDMFVRRIIDNVASKKPIFLQGKDGLRFNPVYIEDMVSAVIESFGLKGRHIINVGGPDVLSLRQLANEVGEYLGIAPIFEEKEGSPVDHVGNISQSLDKLKCRMNSFSDGLHKTLKIDGLIL